MQRKWTAGGVVALALLAGACAPKAEQKASAPSQPQVAAADPVAAGRYLSIVGGCNDCHTPGYSQNGGTTPEAERLTGSPVGYHGPWGTSYASNLRLLVQNTTEDGWVELLRTKRMLPPMPTQNTSKMAEADLRALYRYIHSLGAAGQPEPENLPPGQKPKGPYEDMHVVGGAPPPAATPPAAG